MSTDASNLSSALEILQQQLGNNGSTGISLIIMTQQPMSPTCLFYCQGQQQAQPNIEETGMCY